MIQELVNSSDEQCSQREMEILVSDCNFDGDCGSENVVRCCLVNPSYRFTLNEAITKLLDAKLTIGYIEINDGRCWSIIERRLVESPISGKKISIDTPHAFSKYNSQRNANPKYFREILENSLTNRDIWVLRRLLRCYTSITNTTKTRFLVWLGTPIVKDQSLSTSSWTHPPLQHCNCLETKSIQQSNDQ